MKFLDADAQSRAFVAASIPIFLFGLCVFAEGLLQPINELAYDGIRWFKLLPLIVAGYMAIRANIPSVLNDHLDEFTRHVDLTARGYAGIAAMILLLLSLFGESSRLWSYDNAIDCIVGFYIMVYAGYVLYRMRDGDS